MNTMTRPDSPPRPEGHADAPASCDVRYEGESVWAESRLLFLALSFACRSVDSASGGSVRVQYSAIDRFEPADVAAPAGRAAVEIVFRDGGRMGLCTDVAVVQRLQHCAQRHTPSRGSRRSTPGAPGQETLAPQ